MCKILVQHENQLSLLFVSHDDSVSLIMSELGSNISCRDLFTKLFIEAGHVADHGLAKPAEAEQCIHLRILRSKGSGGTINGL